MTDQSSKIMLVYLFRILRATLNWQHLVVPLHAVTESNGDSMRELEPRSSLSIMNQFASNIPRRNDDDTGDGEPAVDDLEDSPPAGANLSRPLDPDVASQDVNLAEPVEPLDVSNPADSVSEASQIRVGSPFAVDPFEHDPDRAIETIYDVGPLKYTAMGAVSASVLVLGFAAAAAYFFPAGGTMIASLGCILSIFGMYSSYRLTAAALLALHLCLFVVSYGRTLV